MACLVASQELEGPDSWADGRKRDRPFQAFGMLGAALLLDEATKPQHRMQMLSHVDLISVLLMLLALSIQA